MTKTKQTIFDRLSNDYASRPCPSGADPIRHHDREAVRSIVGIAALDVARVAPESRELNHALNKFEEALHWAHSAIDRYPSSARGPCA